VGGTLFVVNEDRSGTARATDLPAPSVTSAEAPADAAPPNALPSVAPPQAADAWAVPAAAIDPMKAVPLDDHLVQVLDDGTRVNLTLDPKLQRVATDVLTRYKVEWGAVVAIRPATGEILAMAEHAEGRPDLSRLALQASPPAASIFKIISSAALLDHGKLGADERICTHGGQSKLTLYNLKANPKLDTKCETFAEALGSSNNVAFARWADSLLEPRVLQDVAERFFFNKRLPFPWAVGVSQARIPTGSRLGFARSAAGFEGTTLSPLHAAMITAAVGNEGKMMAPMLIASAEKDGLTLFEATPRALAAPLSAETARTLTGMLEATMTHGTGRKFFERKGVPRLGKIRAGGKSGSLSGRSDLDSDRHYSWFVALAPIEKPEIAVAVLVVNGAAWTVKGAVPAREVLEAYFGRSEQRPRDPLAQ
jgi:cell division protein FtsI/penicillin-binding protein 2